MNVGCYAEAQCVRKRKLNDALHYNYSSQYVSEIENREREREERDREGWE